MLPAFLRRQRVTLLTLLGLLALAAGLTWAFAGWHLDRSFMTYRYARNLAAGAGLAYNAGAPSLAEPVSPLYAATLALGSRLMADIPLLSNLLGGAAIALAGAVTYLLALPAGRFGAALAGALVTAAPLLWLSLGLEAPPGLALSLLAIWLYLRRRGPAAALALALASLLRPETLVLAAALAADAILTGRRFNALAAGLYAVALAAGLLWLGSALAAGDAAGQLLLRGAVPGLPGVAGTPVPPEALAANVLPGLAVLGSGLLALSPLWLLVALLPVAGVVRLALEPEGAHGVALVSAWAALHLATLLILGAAVYAWHYAPLFVAAATLAGLGAEWAAQRLAKLGEASPGSERVLRVALGALAAGAAAHSLLGLAATRDPASPRRALATPPADPAYAEAGRWLAEHAPPDALVGADEIGVLGYTSGRDLVDAGGRLQPGVAAAQARGDPVWWLAQYAPDYVVLHSDSRALAALTADEWARAAYEEATRTGPGGEVVVMRRTVATGTLVERFAGQLAYPDGLVLSGVATDFDLDPLEGGRVGRVRLEWVLAQPVTRSQQVAVRLESREDALAALTSQALDFSAAPTGQPFTTFHALTLAPALPPGVYDLAVGVGPAADALTWQRAAYGKIPFPETTFVGAVSGSRAEFGDVALVGYRLVRTGAELEVVLLWEAVRAPRADYRVSVQVRDAAGRVVTQSVAEPHSGAYPTSVWSEGERVPDTHVLPLEGLPPGDYAVHAGLIGPGGNRLLTVDGQNAVLVGRVSLAP